MYLLQAKDSVTGAMHWWTNSLRDGTGYPGPNAATELAVVAQHGGDVASLDARISALEGATNYEAVTGSGAFRVWLGPRDVTPSTTIASEETEQIESVTLLANRRHMLTVLLAATGADETEYSQLVHVIARTDAGSIDVTDFEVLRTTLDGEISESIGDFPFTITLSSTGLALEINAENTSEQDANMLAAAQLESYVQPAAPA